MWTDDVIHFDIETQSAADLKQVGGRRYAEHPTTRILTLVACVADVFHVWIPSYYPSPSPNVDLWPAELGERQTIDGHHTPNLPAPIRDAANAGRTFLAHNAWGFDQFVWRAKIAGDDCATPRFLDSLPIARAAGLAGGLEAASKAILGTGKDQGKAILRKFMSMQRSKSTGELFYPTPGPGDIAVIARYNLADVVLQRRLWDAMDVDIEADVLEAHCDINERGIRVDTELTRKLQQVAAVSVEHAADRIKELTNGEIHANNIRSGKAVMAWLASHGVRIRDYRGKDTLKRDVVEQAIANPWIMLEDDTPVAATKDIPPEVFEVLRLRSAALRITSAKAERAIMRCCGDSRARDLHAYWVAHPGRWSSSGIQIHNLPRPKKGVPVAKLLELHESGAWGGLDAQKDYQLIRATLDAATEAERAAHPGKLIKPLSVDDALSSLLRPIFTAADDCDLAIADYNAIECRGVAWIAGCETLLDAFRTGRDPYCEMASRVFGRTIAAADETERQIGKVIVLGCGYGMGVDKFRIFCGLSGVDLGAAGTTAEVCIEAYRQAFPEIAGRYSGQISGRAYRAGGVWDQLGRAAMNAVVQGGTWTAGRCAFYVQGGALICELPSGRRLRYRNVRIEDRVPGYALALNLDKTKPTIVYDGLHGSTILYGGKITENVVQAICRDVLATALVRMRLAAFPVVMHVHDEIAAELAKLHAANRLNEYVNLMAIPPSWASGFPLRVEGYVSHRYRKGKAAAVGLG